MTKPAVTLAQALENYVVHLRTVAKATSAATAHWARKQLVRVLGEELLVAEVGAGAVDRFIETRKAEGAATATINSELRQMRAAVRYCEECGGVDRAPRVRLLKEGRKLPTALSQEQVDRLVRSAPDAATRLAILLAAHAGLRHQEITHLRRDDVDVKGLVIRVTAKPDIGWSPKSHHERAVPMSKRLSVALAERLVETRGPWLFPGRYGRPRVNLHRDVAAAFATARLADPKLKPGLHLLRRTFASALLTGGADVETVRELGGWADLSTVQRYVTSEDRFKRRAIEAVFDGGEQRKWVYEHTDAE